jgi:hypothetical protein
MRGQHIDVGSFQLFARGENFLIDPGYNQPEGANHSVPQIHGMDVTLRAPSLLLGDEKEDRRMLTIDASKAYAKKGNQTVVAFQRTWVMVGDQAVVLLDDIQDSADVVSRFQVGFATDIQPDQRSAIIQGKSSRLWLGAFGAETTFGIRGPLDFGKSWVFKKWADEGKVAWHRLEAPYHCTPEEPMIWVFVPMDADATVPNVKVQRENHRIVVQLPGQPDVIFTKSKGSWQADGFEPKAGRM